MSSVLFSIIVPVYKVEKYLRRCVESILNQSYSNFELILIDDGSPDSSPLICDEYSRQDNRVIVIHQKNQGVSIARNNGIKKAKGNWILFCDSDDWFENDVLSIAEKMMETNECDIIQFGFQYVYPNNKKIIYPTKNIEKNVIYLHFCTLVIKREFIIKNCIFFPESISFAEDCYFKYKLFGCNPKIVINKFISYNYYVNSQSVVQNITKNNIFDEIKIIKEEEKLPYFSKRVLQWHKNQSKDKLLFLLNDRKLWRTTFPNSNFNSLFCYGIKHFIKSIIFLCGLGGYMNKLRGKNE